MRAIRPTAIAALILATVPCGAAAQDAGPEAQPTVLATAEALQTAVSPEEMLSAAWLDPRDALPALGRMTGEAIGKAESGLAVMPYDRIYVAYAAGSERPAVGDALLLVDVGKRVAGYGWMVEPRALLEVEELGAEVMVALVTEMYGVVEAGQLALPVGAVPDLRGLEAEPVEDGAAGEILAFRVSHALQGPPDEAFLSFGAADGLSIGDEVTAYLPRRVASEGRALTLPPEPIAALVVIRVEQRSATARVLDVSDAGLRPGLPVRVTAKMPADASDSGGR